MKTMILIFALFALAFTGFSQNMFVENGQKQTYSLRKNYNIGIGVLNPVYKLQIGGSFAATTYGAAKVTDAEVGYLKGVTSPIQAQISAAGGTAIGDTGAPGKLAAYSATMAAIALKANAANPSFTGIAGMPKALLSATDTTTKTAGLVVYLNGHFYGANGVKFIKLDN